MRDKIAKIGLPLLFGLAFLLLWQLGSFHAILGLERYQLPLPSEIAQAMYQHAPKALGDCFVTVSGALVGMVLGSILGFAVAVVASAFPKWGYGGLILVSAINSIPIVALSPIMNRWFSTGLAQKIGVVTLVSMAAMAINAYRGLTDLRPFSQDLLRSYVAKKREVFFKLRLPNCLPSVFTALKINSTSAMIASIISEYFASSTAGLGFGIKDNLRKAEMAMGWAYITIASIVGILIYLAIVFVERRAIAWHSSMRPDQQDKHINRKGNARKSLKALPDKSAEPRRQAARRTTA